jgi:hypothetical protein
MSEIDVGAAREAARKYKVLVDPLTYLGVFGLEGKRNTAGRNEILVENLEKKRAF